MLVTGGIAGGQQEKTVQTSGPTQPSDLEKLGRNISFDAFLSSPPGQSCATCHDPSAGWTGPRSDINQAGGCWGQPEVAANLNAEELGNLGLTEEEERAIVAFLQTLNDGWLPDGR
ncbi:MAG: cytochrome c peroxidase [Desulfobulbaceae bacterium]